MNTVVREILTGTTCGFLVLAAWALLNMRPGHAFVCVFIASVTLLGLYEGT